jgi:hypothetical protein
MPVFGGGQKIAQRGMGWDGDAIDLQEGGRNCSMNFFEGRRRGSSFGRLSRKSGERSSFSSRLAF